MKRLSLLFTMTILALLMMSSLVSGTPKSKKPIVLRWADVGAPPEQEAILKAAIERINQRTAGKCRIEYHAAGELISMMESFDAVRTKAIEISSFPFGPFGGVEQTINLMNMPFVINNIQAHVAAIGQIMSLYNTVFEKKYNQKILSGFCATPLEVSSVKKPIKTMEDWKGLLCQTLDPSTTAVIKTLGGAPVPIPFIEAYPSLQKGVINATIQANNFALGMKLYEVVNYLTVCTLAGPSMVIVSINLDAWNSLPGGVKDVLLKESQRITEEQKAVAIKMTEEAPKILVKHGMEVYYLPKVERDRWKEALRPYNESLIAEMGEFGRKAAQIFEAANSQYPYQTSDDSD